MIRSVHNDRGTGQPRSSLGLIHLKDVSIISERITFAMTSISINRNDSSARSSLLFQPHHGFALPATNRLTPR